MAHDQMKRTYIFYDHEVSMWRTPDGVTYWTAGDCPEDLTSESQARKWVMTKVAWELGVTVAELIRR